MVHGDLLLEIPPECTCPITQEVMRDPVICADGTTYEKDAILAWFARGNHTSPLSGLRLEHRTLIPNLALRGILQRFQERMPEVQQKLISSMHEMIDLKVILDALAEDQRDAEMKVPTMTLHIKTLDERVYRINVPNHRSKTVGEVKELIKSKLGWQGRTALSHNGKCFADEHKLEDYNVQTLGPGGILSPLCVRVFEGR